MTLAKSAESRKEGSALGRANLELGERRGITITITIMEAANEPIYCPDQPIRTSSFYANGVKLRSPASRSSRWGNRSPLLLNPSGVSTNHIQYALGLIRCGTPLGFEICCPFQPSVRCATLGLWSGTALQFFPVWPPLDEICILRAVVRYPR